MQNGLTIRRLLPDDSVSITQILENVPQFTDEERQCALELVDIYSRQGEASGYKFLVSQGLENKLLGYICFGKIPLTDACFDIYWIVVDPRYQDRGIGTQLLTTAEEKLREAGARKIFVETSSQSKYLSAQNFYHKMGYRLVSYIKDFYKVEDSKLIYVKDIERR